MGRVEALAASAARQPGLMTKVAHGFDRRAAFAIGLEQIVQQVET